MSSGLHDIEAQHAVDDYAWIVDGDSQLEISRYIGGGGVGDVYELLSKVDARSFARKIIHVSGRETKAAIESEARVASLLVKIGGHRNIVTIFGLGWLKQSLNQCYFIDMELCEFSLCEYIDYHYNRSTSSAIAIQAVDKFPPALIHKPCSDVEKLKNVWTIGSHIAQALEFMHTLKYVHRDLKPGNVLYCQRENQWKLTDFGISAKVTSNSFRATQFSRGTSSYRAPELLAEEASFSNKVDIWGLGCVLYELTVGDCAFQGDWAVREYICDKTHLSISLPQLASFLQFHVSEFVQHLLHREPKERPSASNARLICDWYCRLLNLSVARILVDNTSHPSYLEWNELVFHNTDELEFLARLADLYEARGDQSMATAIRNEIMDNEKFGKIWNSNPVAAPSTSPDSLIKACMENGAYRSAIGMCETAITQEPTNFWWWHNLSKAYIAINDFDGAIMACNRGMAKSTHSLVPIIAMSNIYAVRGDYRAAVRRYMEFLDDQNESILWDEFFSQFQNDQEFGGEARMSLIKHRIKSSTSADSSISGKNMMSEMAALLRSPRDPQMMLHFAAWTGNLTLVEMCLRGRNTRPLTSLVGGYTALHLAVWNMHVDVVKTLLDATTTWASMPSQNNWMPLHFATWNNDLTSIQYILNANVPLSPQDMNGRTPIHWAAVRGHVDAIKALIDAGVNCSSRDNHGLTPLHCAATRGHVMSIKALIEACPDVSPQSDNGSQPIHWASAEGHADAIKALVDAGADISAREKTGWTPLHRAATFGHIVAFNALIEAGADVSAVDNNGRTPMHETPNRIVKRLVELGANVSARDNSGRTPMHLAAKRGDIDTVKELAKAGAEASAVDNVGRMPIHYAASVRVTKVLIEAGADVSARDHSGWTPLHLAAGRHQVDTIKALIEAGADVLVMSDSGKTPMDVAKHEGYVDVIMALKNSGADVGEWPIISREVLGSYGRLPLLDLW